MLLHHRRRKALHAVHRISKEQSLTRGARVLAWARSVRWIGWGFGESLLPIFIATFSNTFAEMGLFSSTVDIASLLSLPIIGLWADKVPARRLILWSLALYPLVGIAYFLAGAWGMAIFIVIARIANGITWELENVGIETYYRRSIDSRKMSSSFGYIESWSHIAWIAAALLGILLIRFFPIHYLLFLIAPFSVIAYFMVIRVPNDTVKVGTVVADSAGPVSVDGAGDFQKVSFLRSYGKTLNEWKSWNIRLWLLSALVLFSSLVSNLVYFFIPIDAYLGGTELWKVILLTIFGALPALFGYQIGKFADKRNKYGLIAWGLGGVVLILVGLILIPHYWFKVVAMFLLCIVLELFFVVEGSLVTTLGPEDRYGERGSAFESISVIGDFGSPLLLGVALDMLGFNQVLVVMAALAFLLAIVYVKVRKMKG